MLTSATAALAMCASLLQAETPRTVNPVLATLAGVNFRLVLPERATDGSSVDQWYLGHLTTVSMREAHIRLQDEGMAGAADAMARAFKQLRPDAPVRTTPVLEVRVTTKPQGAFVGFAVWLRLVGEGFDPVSYTEQGIAPPAEEGRSIHAALDRLLKKFLADIASAKRSSGRLDVTDVLQRRMR